MTILLINLVPKIEIMIDNRLMGKTDEVLSNNDEEKAPSYSKALMATSVNLKNILKETKNEKVKQRELQHRSTKFIVHGAEEIGDDPTSVKNNDEK